MIRLLAFSFLFAVALSVNVDAQHRCGTDAVMEHQFQINPAYEEAIERGFVEFNRTWRPQPSVRRSTITIPVHVIIVHPPGQSVGTGDNLSLDHIMSQIDVLNQDFGRYNSDAGNTPGVFSAVDTEIQFCLASQDPGGNSTDGVTRYPTNMDFDSNEQEIKDATRWPREDYLNLWVAPLGGSVLGYAYVPSTSGLPNPVLDGVVVDTDSFGGPGYGVNSPYNLGRTATHEVGHFLGLRHIWRNDGCGADDGIADTPLQDDENYGCPNHPSPSCSNGGDMFMNYMDYVNDNCMNAYTQGQADYMNLILATSRASLSASSGTACAPPTPLTLAVINQVDPSCSDSDDGWIEVEGFGGAGNYEYSIDNSSFSTNNIFTSLGGGTYVITVLDAAGGTVTIDVDLIAPEALFAFASEINHNLCFGESNGSVLVVAEGGTTSSGDYSFSLDGGDSQEDGSFTGLANGTYEVLIVDDNDCEFSFEVEITSPEELLASVSDLQNIDCAGDNSGAVTVMAEGGTGTFSYTLDEGDPQSENQFTNLSPGMHIISVSDENECVTDVEFEVTEPDTLTLNYTVTQEISCFAGDDGSVELTGTGGTEAYMYASNGGDYQEENTFSNLSNGDYTFYIEDANGCQDSVEVSLTEPEEVVISLISQVDVECYGEDTGQIIVEAQGGTGDFTYTLGGQQNQSGIFTGLTSTTYVVIAEDANGCEGSLAVTINQTSSLSLTPAEVTEVECHGGNDGSIEVDASGGSGPYVYSINNGSFSSSNIFEDLSAGTYDIIVQDANECQFILNVEVGEPDLLEVTFLNVADVNCFGNADGSFEWAGTGGTPGYSGVVTDADGMVIPDNELNQLLSGTYFVNITDDNDCPANGSIMINEPSEIIISVDNIEGSDCEEGTLGSVTLSALGGVGDFIYELDGETNMTGVFTELVSGTYLAGVTDANGCEKEISIDIPQTGGITEVSTEQKDVSCHGLSDGFFTVYPSGGSGNYTFVLDMETNDTGTFTDLPANIYSVHIYDGDDCLYIVEVEITEPEILTLDIDDFQADTGGGNGSISVLAGGGIEPYSYSIDGGNNYQASNVFEGLENDTYTIIVKDDNGCEETVSLILTGIEDVDAEFSTFDIFPNPVFDQLNLNFEISSDQYLKIELFDLSGKVVKTISEQTYYRGTHVLSHDISELAGALYLLKVTSEKSQYYYRVIKH